MNQRKVVESALANEAKVGLEGEQKGDVTRHSVIVYKLDNPDLAKSPEGGSA